MKDIKLSIIIPVYNEINSILEVIRLVKSQKYNKEIIIVDDFSTDGTRDILKGINDSEIKVLFNEVNRGKGYCLQRAIECVSGDITIIQDADFEYYPDEFKNLIEKIIEGKTEVVFGSRFLGAHRVFNFYHYLGNTVLNIIANILLDTNLTDLMTGYKAFKTSVLKNLKLKAERFGIETEITAEVFKRKYRVYEVPISYNGRNYDEGKKIKWTDFFVCVYWLFRAYFRTADVSKDVLLKIAAMKNNNLWTLEKIKPFLGGKILELGSGIGTFSRYFINKDRQVTLSDINEEYLDYLKTRFGANPKVVIKKIDAGCVDKYVSLNQFDTVVGINILEHIADDISAIKSINNVLIDGGRVVLFVPACKKIFSAFDKNTGHHNRYSRKDLEGKLKNNGFVIETIEFNNFAAAIGWFINFKIFKRKDMPNFTIKMFDKFIPFISWIEKYIKFPFGLSLFCVARARKST